MNLLAPFLTVLIISSASAQSNSVIHAMSKAAGVAETSQIQEAEKLLKPILEKNPNWGEGWIYLGRSLAAQGNYTEAAAAIEKGGNLGERKSGVWLEACSAALKAGNESLALRYLEQALKGWVHRRWLIQPYTFDGYLDLGEFLEDPAAREFLLEAASIRPSLHPDLISIERRFFVNDEGHLALNEKQIQSLVNQYKQTVETLPEDGELYYRLGGLQVIYENNHQGALASFIKAKELGYLEVFCHGWLANIYAHIGKPDEAFEHLELNLASNDTPGWIFYPGEFDSLYKDPRWKKLVDKYRPTNTSATKLPLLRQGNVPYPTTEWPRVAPEVVGINETTLVAAASSIEEFLPNVTSLLVVRNGQLVFERYFHGYTEKDAFNLKSATKSVTATLAGIMHDQGILPDLNTPIAKILPEYFIDIDPPLKYQITLEHLLTMTSGLDWREGSSKALELFLTGNYAKLQLNEKQLYPPGEVFEYSSAVTHLLATAMAKESQRDLLGFAQENLFGPLGIVPEFWAIDLQDNYIGDGELRLRPQDFAKLGLLVLHGGKWDGKSIVSKEWINKATSIQVPESGSAHAAYGFQFWILNVGGHRVIKAAGYGGQRCWIVPSLDLVCVITSEPITPDNAPDVILGEWIIPAIRNK